MLDVEDRANLFLSRFGRSGSETKNSCFRAEFFLYHFVKHQIGGSEIVRPFARTVDFIYANHTDLPAKLSQVLHEKTFWCYKQHLDLLLFHSFNYLSF